MSKNIISPIISAENLSLLCGALVSLSSDVLLKVKNKNIIEIASKSKGYLGFIDVYNEEIHIYGKDNVCVAKEEVIRLNSQQIREQQYTKGDKIIKIIER